MNIKALFQYVPYVVFVLTMLTYVLRSGFRIRTQALWAVFLLGCFSKFFLYARLGGDSFAPWLPEKVIWIWNWAYSGAMILFLLSLVTLPFRFRARRWLLPLAAWTLSAVGLHSGLRLPDVEEVTLSYPDLPPSLDGYRIAHVTDIHVSSAARRWRTEGIVRLVNDRKVDLVCNTGDFVDGWPETHRGYVEPLKDLRAKDGVVSVTGNHEFFYRYPRWRRDYDGWGFNLLQNACVFPRPGLAVAGTDDSAAERWKFGVIPDVARAFAAATNGEFRILLQHRPIKARENIEKYGVRLQLSGHTHGGVMPLMDRVVALKNAGFSRGDYVFPGGGHLYVSPGSGQWAGFPMRFFNPPKIMIFTLRKEVAR